MESMLTLCVGYIDPGTGSLIIQVIIGTVVAAGVFIKTFWKRIKTFFSRRFGSEQ